MVSRVDADSIDKADLVAALRKTARQAERAGQIIRRIRAFVKKSEPQRQTRACAADRRRRGRTGRHRTAPAQRRHPHLRRAAPAGAGGRPDPDRAGADEPAEERRRGHRQRAAAGVAPQHRTARGAAPHAGRRRRHRVQRHRHGPGAEGRSHRPPVRGLLLHQGRGPGHRPVAVPQHRRVAPRPDAGAEPLQWRGRFGVSFFLHPARRSARPQRAAPVPLPRRSAIPTRTPPWPPE